LAVDQTELDGDIELVCRLWTCQNYVDDLQFIGGMNKY